MGPAGAADETPLEGRREQYELLAQETRHLILQYILAHPSGLPSLDELAYFIPKNRAAIRDQLERLREADIVEWYDHPPNAETRDLPTQFYGLTEYGLGVLEDHRYLRGLPVLRSLYESTRLTDRMERHRDAPRPTLPDPVSERLFPADRFAIESPEALDSHIRKRCDQLEAVEAVTVARALLRENVGPDHRGLTTREVVDRFDLALEADLSAVLAALRSMDVLERTVPSAPTFGTIFEQRGDPKPLLEGLRERLEDEIQIVRTDGDEYVVERRQRVRTILASELEERPAAVGDRLREGPPAATLAMAVEALEDSSFLEAGRTCDRIIVYQPAHRYRLTESAVALVSGDS